jgi:hypothetical protein
MMKERFLIVFLLSDSMAVPMVDIGPVAVDMIRLFVGMLMRVGFADIPSMIMPMVIVAVLMSMGVDRFFVPVAMFVLFVDDKDDAKDHEDRPGHKGPSD